MRSCTQEINPKTPLTRDMERSCHTDPESRGISSTGLPELCKHNEVRPHRIASGGRQYRMTLLDQYYFLPMRNENCNSPRFYCRDPCSLHPRGPHCFSGPRKPTLSLPDWLPAGRRRATPASVRTFPIQHSDVSDSLNAPLSCGSRESNPSYPTPRHKSVSEKYCASKY